MDIKTLSETLTVSGQLTPSDIDALASRGVKHLICNRPDREAADQPQYAVIADRAKAAGIQCHFLPVVPGQITAEDISQFGALLSSGEVTHAYCRTGTRCTHLWALSQAAANNIDDIINTAAAAGYDISALRDTLSQRASQ